MNKLFTYLIVCVVALLSPVAWGGDFALKIIDSSGVWYEYTSTVLDSDAEQLRGIMKTFPGKNVFVTINSGGGSAFGGLALFWEAERWDNLTTIAGKDYGAWSAAGIFWLGSPRDWFESKESKVGFHQAYCNPYHPPGCDIGPFRARLIECLNKAGYHGITFDAWLSDVQRTWGVSGWALLTDEGWFLHHSRYGPIHKIIPPWEI